jgi:pimeloyl-ACP methyl ester carboxylesterase
MPNLRREPRMPNVNANGIRIEYDEFGDRTSPPLLLIMGLGGQMVRWDMDFCRQLVDRGFRVIRFDNRDVGLSTKFHEQCPHPGPLLVSVLRGESVTPPYTLDDMAGDAAALLEEMGIPAAHVVGASMGGMIAQLLAIRYPDKVLTLTSIMSTTGNRDLPQGDPNVLALLMRPVPTEREAAFEHAMDIWRALAGPAFPFDEARNWALVELCYDRDSDPTGIARQMLAIMTAGSRKDLLRSVTKPALVIHGDADPLVPIVAGFDTVEAIPGARMLVIEGMGHELPEGAWPRVIDAIVELTQQAH